MTTRSINECFDFEELEEKTYTRYIAIDLSKTSILVVDPYMINIRDLIDAKFDLDHERTLLVRARRSAWGVGDLHRYIFAIKREGSCNVSKPLPFIPYKHECGWVSSPGQWIKCSSLNKPLCPKCGKTFDG